MPIYAAVLPIYDGIMPPKTVSIGITFKLLGSREPIKLVKPTDYEMVINYEEEELKYNPGCENYLKV